MGSAVVYLRQMYTKGGWQMQQLQTKRFETLPQAAKTIRERVFMQEQGFQEEFDEQDNRATHLVLYDGAHPVGCCRYFFKGDTYIFGRLAIEEAYRGQHMGERMLQEAEREIRADGGKMVMLHAQCQAQAFYQKQGYTAFGVVENEEHCPHIWMKKVLEES